MCYDVPIARTGTQKYGPGETLIPVGSAGFTLIHREPDEVFRAETIASFQGKPIVNDHPTSDVTPDNWRNFAMGTVINPRKGTGDLLVADLILTDREGISLVNSGKVEVSCGYDADYEEIGPGEGRQLNIIGNHLALVERGRCGPRCSIGDESYKPEHEMTASLKVLDYLRTAFKAKDESELADIEKRMGDAIPYLTEPTQAIHVHIGSNPVTTEAGNLDDDPPEKPESVNTYEALMQKMDVAHAEFRDCISGIRSEIKDMKSTYDAMMQDDEGDDSTDDMMTKDDESEEDSDEEANEGNKADKNEQEVKSTSDSAKFADVFVATCAGVEIVYPGARLKTFDASADPKVTLASLHSMRLDAISHAAKQPETAALVVGSLGGKSFDRKRTSSRDASAVFNAVVAYKRAQNNAPNRQSAARDGAPAASPQIRTLADLNLFLSAQKYQ